MMRTPLTGRFFSNRRGSATDISPARRPLALSAFSHKKRLEKAATSAGPPPYGANERPDQPT